MRWLPVVFHSFLLVLGLVLLVNHERVLEYWDQNFGMPDSRPAVAKVLQASEGVLYRLPQSLVYKKVRPEMTLRLRDTITTDSQAQTKLQFLDGLELQVSENSVLLLEPAGEDASGSLKISFLRGNFKILKRGKPGGSNLIKNSENKNVKEDVVIDPSADKSLEPVVIRSKPSSEFRQLVQEKKEKIASDETKEGVETLDALKPVAASKLELSPVQEIKSKDLGEPKQEKRIKKSLFELREEKETLPESHIVDVIQKQKAFFNRCYAQHLRLNPEAEGRIDFSFTIHPNGKVVDVRVLRATIKDTQLQRCSMSVIERAEFRRFNGDPMVINYPFYFE